MLSKRITAALALAGMLAVLIFSHTRFAAVKQPSLSLPADQPARARLNQAFGQLPLSFEANRGQTDPAVKFLSRGPGYSLFLTSTEAVLQLRVDESVNAGSPRVAAGLRHPPSAVLRMKLVGATAEPQVEGASELPGRVNYLIGNDPRKWRTEVQTYGRVRYREVYPGVDVVYYGHQRQLEYDFIVAAGADPHQIALGFEGAEQIEIDARGELVLRTAAGIVRQHRPIIYQEAAGGRREIAGRYVRRSTRHPGSAQPAEANSIGFEVEAYDPSLPLIIDPTLAYSTYFGGSAAEIGYGIAVDPAGNIYVTGETFSTNFPLMNPSQATIGMKNAGGVLYPTLDVFVTKFNAAGTGLIFSTYLGGSGSDQGFDLALDSANNVCLTGRTSSVDFPVANAFQPHYSKNLSSDQFPDAFVTKFNAAGSGLIFSTYLGGNSNNIAHGIAVDSHDNLIVVGQTDSDAFPTVNARQPALAGGTSGDAFVAKFTAMGSIVFSTYHGGKFVYDIAGDVAVDSSDNIYVAGSTPASDFPTTQGVLQPNKAGEFDAFVSKFSPDGQTLVYSTFLGGGACVDPGGGGNLADPAGPNHPNSCSADSSALGIKVDAAGNAYVTGRTNATNFPTTAGAFQSTFGGGTAPDVFVTKLNPTATALVYSTYLGGSDYDGPSAWKMDLAIDAAGNAYVTGNTSSANFPLVNPLQSQLNGGNDAFITMLSAAGGVAFSTLLGGSDSDQGNGIAVDAAGAVYVTGFTNSCNFPVMNAYQSTNGDPQCSSDAIVVKITGPGNAGGFVVNSAGDEPDADANDGVCDTDLNTPGNQCTLRAAIRQANNKPGAETITFNIPGGGVPRIQPHSPLPQINEAVTIDATTQPNSGKVEIDGNSAGLTANGLVINSGNCTIKGLVINRFSQAGILVDTGGGNQIQGNFIGTDATGTIKRGNGADGIYIFNSPNNQIGGTTAGAGNLIAGNGGGGCHDSTFGTSPPGDGIFIEGAAATGNQVQGNLIGTDVSGAIKLPNGCAGVAIQSSGNTVGGTLSGARNLISGNGRCGVRLVNGIASQAQNNLVQGNYIGTDLAGTAKLGNGSDGGVFIIGSNTSGNLIGGASAAMRNLISGNGAGVRFEGGAHNNQVQGNFIGTDANGMTALGNQRGVYFVGSNQVPTNNTIGGTAAGEGNLISGNDSAGVEIFSLDLGVASTGNRVQGNYIGPNVAGAALSGGTQIGVSINSNNNTLGGTGSGAGNLIAFNASVGVVVTGGTSNALLGNAIHANGSSSKDLGIDLVGAVGVNQNDQGDGDSGPNELQNYPVIAEAGSGGGSTAIQWTFNSKANLQYRVEFFANTACDASGYGEGQTYLGATTMTTNASGDASLTTNFAMPLAAGQFITATATDPANNTSEFSRCVSVNAVSPTNFSFPGNGGSGSVNVTAPNGATWTATSNVPWITFNVSNRPLSPNFTDNGTVNFTVATNTSGVARTGTLTVSGVTITVNQGGTTAVCAYTLSPSSLALPAGGGSGAILTQTLGGCAWSATSNTTWITLTSGTSGTGVGATSYTVVPNTAAISRSGAISIGGQPFSVRQGANFDDVPATHPFYAFIGQLSARGITNGCRAGNYCPDTTVTREQMAILLIRSLGNFTPPQPTQPRFADVSPARGGYAFIEELARLGITAGCGGGNFCPDQPVTREQMAIFIERALGVFTPPKPAQQTFLDVSPARPSYPFIEDFARRGITAGCGGGNYCPDNPVTRGQTAVFLVRAFNL